MVGMKQHPSIRGRGAAPASSDEPPVRTETIRGRGAALNPPNRFERIEYVPAGEARDPDDPGPLTQILRDATRTIIARNDSPDVGFETSINPYRGCEHGCAYCFARPFHEYLGFSAGLDFETRIVAKLDAPELLRRELMKPSWTPKPIAMSGVTDPYQPVERRLKITRRCLAVLAEFRNPVIIITKSYLVTRDIDHLTELAAHGAVSVNLSITTLDPKLQRAMEPRASTPRRRLQAVEALARAGIPVGVMVAPIVPGLTDSEVPAILQAAADAGAQGAGYVVLRLPHGVKELFEDWLGREYPDRKERALNRVREMRGGALYDSQWFKRAHGEGPYAEQIGALFESARRSAGLDQPRPELSIAAFRRPDVTPRGGQLGLEL
jgi:DNA repair photolyase